MAAAGVALFLCVETAWADSAAGWTGSAAALLDLLRENETAWGLTSRGVMGLTAGLLTWLVAPSLRLVSWAGSAAVGVLGLMLSSQICRFYGYAFPDGVTVVGFAAAFTTCVLILVGARVAQRV